MGTRPAITIDPAVRFGLPSVGGVTTEDVAGMVWAGEPVDAVADEYHLTRHQVLLACWWEGTSGGRRRQWREWADAAHPTLAGWAGLAGRTEPASIDTLPDPPPRPRAARKAA
ncbi:DUF433 domain-containing protein [Micromonospora rifamycinica]|uniref:DUF433 domain-containing protein n=1 Tax=Micromonospora rifamycinica TaxID=291594 RepID=UPI0033D4AD17